MNPERLTGNLLEGMRFAADLFQDRRSPEGLHCMAHVLDLCSVLWHQGQVREGKVLLAGLLFHLPAAQAESARKVFGAEVVNWAQQAQQPEGLAVPDFQRLQPKEQVERLRAGRQILLAAWCAEIRQRTVHLPAGQDLAAAKAWLEESLAPVRGFASTEPLLEATLTSFAQAYLDQCTES